MELLSPKLFPEYFCFEKEIDFQVENGAAVQHSAVGEHLIVIYNDPRLFSKHREIIFLSQLSSPSLHKQVYLQGWILLWVTSTTTSKS